MTKRGQVVLGTLVAIVTLATGVLTLKGQLFPSDDKKKDVVVVRDNAGEVPRFERNAGHLKQSEALLRFLDLHDGDAVYLKVAFPSLATGPAGGDNVIVESVAATGGGNRSLIKEIALMTECPAQVASADASPTPVDGCMGSGLDIDGAETKDASTYFEHGVPVIKGYFKVDVTGNLHQGLSAILLRPLTAEEAKS
jgi:hypothetical protein